ncbi:hypothetical protein EUX98_g1608 [Antrodiella citrinella]|uniref:AAA+ ATPase domain-containing protein n=1 Tax=Antrodiella citrinella TaxID=2447956 RepID=A0A4S4N2H7_9APHY|nr:hypothetical protein EUX98_g1608 [Antrodiella citrinella]
MITIRSPVYQNTDVVAFFCSLLVANILQSAGTAMSAKWAVDRATEAGGYCRLQGGLKQAGNVGIAVWTFALSTHIFTLLFLRWKHSRLGSYLTLGTGWFFVVFIVSIGPLALQDDRGSYLAPTGLWCWISNEYPKEQLWMEYFFEFLSAGLSLIIYTIILLRVRGNLYKAKGVWFLRFVPRGESWQLAIQRDVIDASMVRIAARIVWFPIAYTVLLLPIAICRLLASYHVSIPYWVTIITDVFFNLQGLVNILLLLLTRRYIPDLSSMPDLTNPRHSVDMSTSARFGITPFILPPKSPKSPEEPSEDLESGLSSALSNKTLQVMASVVLARAAQSRRPLLVALAVVLLLRSRLLHLPKDVVRNLSSAAYGKKLSQEELSQVLQQVYVDGPDGTKTLLVPYRDRVSEVSIKPYTPSELASDAKNFTPVPPTYRPNLDKTFLRQLRAILRITFPSWHSKETLLLILHSFFLVARTVLSVGVARLDGRIVRDLVSADGKGFLKGLGLWFLLAIPSTYTNTMIHHLQAKLSLRLRTRLSRYTNDLYLSSAPDLRYYRVGHEGGLDGVDQYITADVSAFCEAVAGIYGNVMKPSLDLVLFTTQLSRTLGVRGTLLLFLNYYVTAKILRAVTPAFGRLAAVEARLEGEYRAGMARVGRESEEVAFYNGGPRERDILWRAYLRLIKHINSIYKIRIAYEWTEDYVIKYLWSAAGYALIAVPVLLTRRRNVGIQTGENVRPNDEVANRTETYISSRRLLLSLADAGGRVMYAQKDLLELAGLTTRLYSLLSTLHNLPSLPKPIPSSDSVELSHVDVAIPSITSTPTVLVKDLSLSLQQGEHLMITGSNGVGKTAVARLELEEILAASNLAYLPSREGGWYTRKEWRDVLSGGEKQRMGLARVFYHKPKFAILDECTSAVSSDVEGRMYEHAKSLGVTLITISLRPSLMKYHNQLLTINGDGLGSWSLTKIGTAEERMGLDREIIALEKKLQEVAGWEKRVHELTKALSVQEA